MTLFFLKVSASAFVLLMLTLFIGKLFYDREPDYPRAYMMFVGFFLGSHIGTMVIFLLSAIWNGF